MGPCARKTENPCECLRVPRRKANRHAGDAELGRWVLTALRPMNSNPESAIESMRALSVGLEEKRPKTHDAPVIAFGKRAVPPGYYVRRNSGGLGRPPRHSQPRAAERSARFGVRFRKPREKQCPFLSVISSRVWNRG